MADDARAHGYTVVDWGEPADIAIVNSCALTLLAEAKTRQDARIFARKNPDGVIAVTGCYAQTAANDIAKIDGVKWVIGNPAKLDIIDIIENNPPRATAQIFLNAPAEASKVLAKDGAILERTNLKIQDGCDNFCAYCIIPRARGLPQSRDFADIVRDAKNLVSRGVREIILTGINIAKFSSPKGSLIELIDELNAIPNLLRLRLGSIEPPHFDMPALLERMGDTSHILAPHFHISAQSLSDKVLAAMRRKYTALEFLNLIETARSRVPDISIGADIICGHPGEDEKEFEITLAAAAHSALTSLHVFTFSPRPQTVAATMKDSTPPKPIRKARADQLRAIGAELENSFIKSQIGKTRPVLLENQLPNSDYLSYTDNYIQTLVNIPAKNLRNKLADVKIVDTQSNRAFAKLVRLH